MRTAKKILTTGLTAVYFALALIGPFALFHQHQLPLQDLVDRPSHELHDASCDFHVKTHLHLSDHCAACQFTSLKQTDVTSYGLLADNGPASCFSTYDIPAVVTHPFLSTTSGRAPPSFLS